MSEKNKAVIRRFYEEVFAAGKMNIAAIDHHLADDFVGHDLPPGLNGRAGYKNFEAKVRYQPGAATIDLTGQLTILAGEALNQAYSEAEGRAPEVVLLNFSQVSYINSAGIALLISLLARVRQSHCSLMAYGLSSQYEKIFELSRLTEFIQILPNRVTLRI